MFYLDTVKSCFQLLSLLMYCGIFFSCLCHLARVFKGLLATEALTEPKALRYVFPIRHMWPPQKKHLQSCSHSAVEKSFQTPLKFYKALNVCRKKCFFCCCVFSKVAAEKNLVLVLGRLSRTIFSGKTPSVDLDGTVCVWVVD